jgi:ribosomal protein S18 acetylase RimI-like enzyme
VPALSALAKRTWSDAFGASVNQAAAATELNEGRSEHYFESALEENVILVTDVKGELVGDAEIGNVRIPEVDAQPDDMSLHRLYVDTALHGHGVGRQLMTGALGHPTLAAAKRVYLQVWSENTRARRLYEHFGFHNVSTTTFTIGSDVMEDLIMRLDKTD